MWWRDRIYYITDNTEVHTGHTKMPSQRGEEVHGEHAAAAATGQEITLYGQEQVARTLAATESLVVTDITVSASEAATVTVFSDKDDDDTIDTGERIFVATFVGSNFGPVSASFVGTPFYGAKGAKPHVITTAGTVYLTMTGYILKA